MTEHSPTTEALSDRLIALKPEGLSTRAWTINAGVGSGFFDQIAAGGAPRDGELPKVLAVVGVTLAQFDGRRRTNSQPVPASPPALRLMPRPPKPPAPAAEADSAPPVTMPTDEGAKADEQEAGETGTASQSAAATARAIERWLEVRRQAEAAGLDTHGVEGIRLVTDLTRLALDLERATA
jgi:hypothetical protein